jgi:hypothetical protein
MSSYLLSILLPPQPNFKTLKDNIEHITNSVENINNIEIIVKISQIDIEDYLPNISELLEITPHIKILISDNQHEDTLLLESIKNQTLIADGEFLLLLNNGIFLNLPDLDVMVKKYHGKLCVIEGKNNLSFTSPLIVHHKIVNILGLQSLFNLMCSELGIEIKEPLISYNVEGLELSGTNFNWEDGNKLGDLKSFIDTLKWSKEWLPLVS